MSMNIQWFPGHMAKTGRLIQENLKLIDIVCEIADARIPYSSRNPYLDSLISSKPRLIILNKADIADESITDEWIRYYDKKGIRTLTADSKNSRVFTSFSKTVREILEDELKRRADRGMSGKSIRVMVTGVPNVGKSTFINNLSGKASAKTGDRPGVTTGKQWIKIQGGIELLDTPGMLWQKFENPRQGMNLAFTGAIKDTVVDLEELSVHLLNFLRDNYTENLCQRYKLSDIKDLEGYEILVMIGKKRGFLMSGGDTDTERTASILIDEFRGAKLGRISLERPDTMQTNN